MQLENRKVLINTASIYTKSLNSEVDMQRKLSIFQ